MGDMGTITFDQGVGGNGFGSIDDTSPTAYGKSLGSICNCWLLRCCRKRVINNTTQGYYTIMGVAINSAYDPATGDADQGDGAAGQLV